MEVTLLSQLRMAYLAECRRRLVMRGVTRKHEMNPMHALAGVVALCLLIYLVVAMLKPEIFP